MNLRQLEIFIRVTETKSMSEAARQLYISQPAVSQTIAELEDSLETKLFERINRRLFLTDSGELLYAYAKRIIGLLSEAEHQIKDLANLKRGKLSVGASTTIGIYLLPQIIGNFKKLYPDIEFIFTIDNTSIIETLLLDAQIDIGIVEGPIFSKDLDLIHFAHDRLEIICSSEHKWAISKTKQISVRDFEEETLIFREEGSGTREIIENVLNSKGVNYRAKHFLNNTEAIKKAVEANIGIGIVSEFAVRDELNSGRLFKVDLKGIRFTRELDLVIHKKKYKSEILDKFISFLKDYEQSSTLEDLPRL